MGLSVLQPLVAVLAMPDPESGTANLHAVFFSHLAAVVCETTVSSVEQ